MTLALSYQNGRKNSVIYFQFEQLSTIPVVPLLLTFNKYTACGVSSFSIHHLYISKHNWSDGTEHFRRNKQEMSPGKKTIEEKQIVNEP